MHSKNKEIYLKEIWLPSGALQHVVLYIFTDVSEEPSSSIIRVMTEAVSSWLTDWLRWGETMSQNCSHQPGDIWAWRAMVMIPAGDNSWLVHQSPLAVLPTETSGASRKNGRRSENFAYQYVKYLEGSLTCCKILRHVTSGFTSNTKEGVLRIFIALKNPSPRPGLNPRLLGPVASTLTTTPPRRPVSSIHQATGW
jgi:hypothetical protein